MILSCNKQLGASASSSNLPATSKICIVMNQLPRSIITRRGVNKAELGAQSVLLCKCLQSVSTIFGPWQLFLRVACEPCFDYYGTDSERVRVSESAPLIKGPVEAGWTWCGVQCHSAVIVESPFDI